MRRAQELEVAAVTAHLTADVQRWENAARIERNMRIQQEADIQQEVAELDGAKWGFTT